MQILQLGFDERALLRESRALTATLKISYLLKILVQNHGRIVKKGRLIADIWADSFVENENLTRNIRVLCKVPGDDAAMPQFIDSIQRRDYRFIAKGIL